MKTRIMYMHTLDGKPASYDDSRGPYIYFVALGSGRDRARLVSSLRQIRRQQHLTANSPDHQRNGVSTYRGRLGYIRVEVPA